MTEYRAAILWVSPQMTRKAKRAIPPEHRIAAIREDPDNRVEHWLIEGPWMPPLTASGLPDIVSIVLTVSWPDDESEVRLDAALEHDRERVWRVGVWPDHASFMADFSD